MIDKTFILNTLKIQNIPSVWTGCYLGIDIKQPYPHLGHLLMMLWLRNLGHIVPIYLLVGDFTIEVGDISGNLRLRELARLKFEEQYKHSFLNCCDRIFFNRPLVKVYNSDWLENIKLKMFIKELEKVTLNRVVRRDVIKNRLNNCIPVRLSEVTYSILQGWDFWHLNKYRGVNIQLAGIDQYNNVLHGIKMTGGSCGGMFVNLVTDKKGKKISSILENGYSLDPRDMCVWGFLKRLKGLDLNCFMSAMPMLASYIQLEKKLIGYKYGIKGLRDFKKHRIGVGECRDLVEVCLKCILLTSRKAAKHYLKNKGLVVNELTCYHNTSLKPGDRILLEDKIYLNIYK